MAPLALKKYCDNYLIALFFLLADTYGGWYNIIIKYNTFTCGN